MAGLGIVVEGMEVVEGAVIVAEHDGACLFLGAGLDLT